MDNAPPKTQHALVSAIFSKIIQNMEIHLDMTIRQKPIFECLRATHAQDFLMTILLMVLANICHQCSVVLDSSTSL